MSRYYNVGVCTSYNNKMHTFHYSASSHLISYHVAVTINIFIRISKLKIGKISNRPTIICLITPQIPPKKVFWVFICPNYFLELITLSPSCTGRLGNPSGSQRSTWICKLPAWLITKGVSAVQWLFSVEIWCSARGRFDLEISAHCLFLPSWNI